MTETLQWHNNRSNVELIIGQRYRKSIDVKYLASYTMRGWLNFEMPSVVIIGIVSQQRTI